MTVTNHLTERVPKYLFWVQILSKKAFAETAKIFKMVCYCQVLYWNDNFSRA